MEQKGDNIQSGGPQPGATSLPSAPATGRNDLRLFIACFAALITTAFGFIVRAMVINQWAEQFGLSGTEKGQIFGAGLWPFAISIVLFSLVIDRIGYGRAIAFAFVCHLVSAITTMCAPLVLAPAGADAAQVAAGHAAGYWILYVGNFIVALGNGTVEAVINPVVATMFPRAKTKWLNILHAGWPGGLVVGGILAIGLGHLNLEPTLAAHNLKLWQVQVGIVFIPLVVYGVMMIGCKFPVSERVEAGVTYREMLKEAGFLGALVVVALIVFEVSNDLEGLKWIFQGDFWQNTLFSLGGLAVDAKLVTKLAVILALTGAFGLYVRSLGRPMFIFLILIMIPLATTELGTDSWIISLMETQMKKISLDWNISLDAGWVLVYTSFIMMVLRFFAGPIVHRISPLGLLAVSSAIAACGLVSLSLSTGLLIFAAATLYGFGKTFFWPTMLGVVAEQYPKGGALTLNMTGGIGMLGVGIIGAALLGNVQDREIDKQLAQKDPALYSQVVGQEKVSVFGAYKPLDENKVKAASDASAANKEEIDNIQESAKKSALMTVAIFPCIMLVCYLILIVYFWSRGGYHAQVLVGHKAVDKEFTGGVPGPAEL